MPKKQTHPIATRMFKNGLLAKTRKTGNTTRSTGPKIIDAITELSKLGVEAERLEKYCTNVKAERQVPPDFQEFCRPILQAVKAGSAKQAQIMQNLKPIFLALEARMLYEQRRKALAESMRLDEEYKRIING